MPKFLLFLFLFCFIFSGCTALKSEESLEEGAYDTEEASEDFADSEGEYSDEDEGDEDDYTEDDEYAEDDEEGEEEEYADEEGEKKGGISGFFSRLFGGEEEEEVSEFEEEEISQSEEEYTDYTDEAAVEDDDYSEESGERMDKSSSQDDGLASAETDSAPGARESPAAPQESPPPATDTAAKEPEKPSFIPLNKIMSAAYKKAGYLVNAVYIARENETLPSVSQKIYGSDKTSELYAINPHLQSRSVKVGDKIYYNSPLRPNDNSRLLFYYKDINAAGSSYSLSPGDNIRSVSSKLLGHPNSWKEIWATNPALESKGEVLTNVNIVYWPKTAAAPAPAVQVVETAPAQGLPGQEAETAPPAPEEPSADEAPQRDFAQEEAPSPPEESRLEQPVQLPEPPPEQKKSQPGLLQAILEQKEIAVGLLGVIVMLILMIRVIRKKRKQKDFDYTATNIEV